MISRFIRFAACCLLLTPPAAAQTPLRIAAASDLQFVLPALTARFERETHQTVDVSFGSSGNFFAQLQNGAPFDIFFSANLDYPRKLDTAGLVEPGSYFEYATGKIVVWVPADSKLDINTGARSLLNPAVKKIAIANPQHAPYGQAAVAALKKEGVYDKISEKLVLGENVSQTASFVASGAADVGIVALSLALGPNMKDKGRFKEVPADAYPPIEQACVILKSSQAKGASQEFLQFVRRSETQEILRAYGFGVPVQSEPAK